MASRCTVLLVVMFGSVSSQYYTADINMAGIHGRVELDASSRLIQFKSSMDCGYFNISLHQFPVMYGNSDNPCDQANIGEKIYQVMTNGTAKILDVFQPQADLSDLTVTVGGCRNLSTACASLRKGGYTYRTWQGKFFSSIAGDVYIRQDDDGNSTRVLTDLVWTKTGSPVPRNVSLYLQVGAERCAPLGQTTWPLLGTFKVGAPLNPVKDRGDGVAMPVGGSAQQFLYVYDGTEWFCAEIRLLEAKKVWAYIDMEAVHGTFKFYQVSPFDTTNYSVSLANLREMANAYHVHNFPVPPRRTPKDQLCANDNLGGHWNPFGKNATGPSYPQDTNGTHDQYEMGDLSGRHGFLKGLLDYEATFEDWNLPLFGRNSIVGRSVIIHHPDSSRWFCATIGYPGEVMTAVATFKSPVAGRIIFQQLKSNPYSDLSIFMDLSYTSSSAQATTKHLWQIHEYPISSERDSDPSACSSTKMIFNPTKVDVGAQYGAECGPASPFCCQVGDYAKKHKTIDLTNSPSVVKTKNFFTDTTSALAGPLSIVSRSVVINKMDMATSPLACANVTILRPVSLEINLWRGTGTVNGNVTLKQLSDLDRTVVQVNLTHLKNEAGSYSIHTLPIKDNLPEMDACSDAIIGRRYNPFGMNGSLSPEPGNGTVDQYEVGDISGKFGTLNNLSQLFANYMDQNLPLFGPHSVVSRSLVIYQTFGSPSRCANLLAVKATGGEYIRAKAEFNGTVKGTIILSQQVFADGSSFDTTMEIALEPAKSDAVGIDNLMWHVHTYQRQFSNNCSGVGGHYNPYNIDTGASYKSSCSSAYPLHCEVGDLESKQGLLTLKKRDLKTDVHLPLYGDFTVVGRSVVIHNKGPEKTLMDCANIVAESPMKSLTYPKVDPFSRYEFRSTVAEALGIATWRVNILPGSPSTPNAKGCQEIRFYMAGDVDKNKLDNLANEQKMGKFKASDKCTSDPIGGTPGLFPNVKQFIFWMLTLMMQLVLYTVFE